MTTRAALNLSAAVAAASALALLLDAPARAQEPVRMGILQAVTGPFTKNGTENGVAMQIARDMINERGGIPGHGRRIEYVFADAPTPTAAISETERLITRDGVKITSGSGLSPLAIAVS